jgi:ribosomal protein S18 acetylase RimI-like enzyme
MIRLRPAKVGDARGIARIHVETWRNTYAGILPDRTLVSMTVDGRAAAWRRSLSHIAKTEVVLVAEAASDGLVGFASAGRNREPVLPFVGEVQTLYVLPDWQNQGIGRKLLEGCFARLGDQGLSSALVWVLSENPARFFYERMGGRRSGERDEHLWGARVHELAYGWKRL